MTDQRDLNQLWTFISQRFDDMNDRVDRLTAQVATTNGRVTKLEGDRIARAAAAEVRQQMREASSARKAGRIAALVTIGAAAVTSVASVVATLVAHYIQ